MPQEEDTEGESAMTWSDIHILFLLVLSFAPPVALLVYFFWNWYRDYKNYKFQKNRPRILNPWSDW